MTDGLSGENELSMVKGRCFMNRTENRLWSLYTEDSSFFLNENVIAVDRRGLGDLTRFPSDRDAFRVQYESVCRWNEGFGKTVEQNLLYNFAYELVIGDYVLLRTAHDKPVELGRVTGEYYYHGDNGEYPHRRSVQWLKCMQPEEISTGAMREISYSSASPLFLVRHYDSEFLAALGVCEAVPREPAPRIERSADHALCEYVLGELSALPAYHGCKEFVAGLLQAMGYHVTMLSRSDGVDMVAHRDELMPRVLVRVKKTELESADVRAILNTMKKGEHGILITLSELSDGMSAEIAAAGLRGVSGKELTQLTLKYYDALDERYRRMIPLKTVFVPAA